MMPQQSRRSKARQLYNHHLLHQNPGAAVLVTNDERVAEAARQLFLAHIPTAWSHAPEETDWSPLNGREVAIWTNHDAPGREAAERVAQLALNAGAASVEIIEPPPDKPQGWSPADARAEGWTERDAQDWWAERGRPVLKEKPKAPRKLLVSTLPLTSGELQAARITPTCIVENYLFADVGVLAAPGGTGKTTLQIYEAVCIILGRLVHGLKVAKPGKVLLVTAEDRREQLAARLREVMDAMELTEAEREQVLAGFLIWDVTGENLKLIRQSDGNIIPTGLADEIVSAFRDDPPVLVVFDPVVSFGVSEGMVNDNEQGIITACRRIVRGLDCCVRAIAHTGKANAREGTLDQYSSRGGSALADGSRMFAVLKNWTPEDTTHTPPPGCTWTPETSLTILARPKLSYAPPQPHIWIRRTGWKYEAFVEVRRTREEKQAETYDKVLLALEAELKAGAKHTKTSLEGAIPAIPRGELRKAISRLMALGRIVEVDLPPEEQRTRRKTYLALGSSAASFGSIPKNQPEDEADKNPGNNAAAYREDNGGIIPPPIISQFSNDASVDRQDSAGLAGLPKDHAGGHRKKHRRQGLNEHQWVTA